MDGFKLEPLSIKIPKIDPSAYGKNLMEDLVKNVNRESEETFKIIEEEKERREKREEENRENLRKAAENTEITNQKLEKQIQQKDEDLQNQRELIQMLRNQLMGISRTLSDMFILEENIQEKHEEANILAREIYASLIQKSKIDWKALAVDKGIDVVIAAIPIVLQLAQVL